MFENPTNPQIHESDVKYVAKDLGLTLKPKDIETVIRLYPQEQKADPTGAWYLVVEHIITDLL